MRAIDRPQQTVKRYPGMSYAVYGQTLVRTFGAYCIACEAPLPSGVQVEHRLAQQDGRNATAMKYDTFELQYLVACGACNSRKSAKVATLADLGKYLWPDAINTFTAFQFANNGAVLAYADLDAFRQDLFPNSNVSLVVDPKLAKSLEDGSLGSRAQATINLWGFNSMDVGAFRTEVAADMRMATRKSAYAAAEAVVTEVPAIAGTSPALPAAVAYAIIGTGYWTIWLHRFLRHGRTDLAQRMFTDARLKDCFPSAADCVSFTGDTLTLKPHAEPKAIENFQDQAWVSSLDYVERLGYEAAGKRTYTGPCPRIGGRGGPKKRGRDDDDDPGSDDDSGSDDSGSDDDSGITRPGRKKARRSDESSSASSSPEVSFADDSSDDAMDVSAPVLTSSPATTHVALSNSKAVRRSDRLTKH